MKSTKQAAREARQLFRLCLVNGSLDEARVQKAVQGVLQSKRRGGYLLLSRFLRLLKIERSRHTAEVESAALLPPDLQDIVRAGVARVYGPGISISFAQIPALIGGMRIKVGSDVYDGSVKAGLDALEKRF
jgi:F-type H+-transporting ATPase subunit delta